MTNSLAEVVGRNARDLRRSVDATLEDVAALARGYGLRWSTGSVGSLESGRTVGVNLENLLAVAATLGDVVGRPVSLADMFAGDGDVALNDELTVPLATVRATLSGEVVSIPAPVPVVPIAGAYFPAVGTVRYSLPVSALCETDLRVCRSLGVEPEVGAAAMARLWKKTFVAKRDELAGSNANPQRRGRISRQLKTELQKVIADGDYSEIRDRERRNALLSSLPHT